MVQLVIRVVINAIALWVAGFLLREQGLTVPDDPGGLILVAVVFGLVNAFIKPIVQILTCPLTVLTLGLFTLVINMLMLMLTGWLTGGAVTIGGIGPAFLGALIISVVSTVLSWFLVEQD
jgi:putative membrane protein